MSHPLVDPRDQKFVLHDMLNVEQLCQEPVFKHLSKQVFDMSLNAARELSTKESYPIIAEADSQGCRLENGQVIVPPCFQRLKTLYTQGEWPAMQSRRENGGQGYPLTMWLAMMEYFMPNGSFMWLMNKPFSGTAAIEMFGSESQRRKYLPKLVSGAWGSAVAANDDSSGCDVSMQTATALPAPDGTYRLKGIKSHVTGGHTDLFENHVHIVLACIEGDPPEQPSLFIVPERRVHDDGSLGSPNDLTIVELQEKMGFNGAPTCRVGYGDKDDCHAELLGPPRQAMAMVLPLLQNGYMCCGIQATATASAAYRHALDHARKRLQGAGLQDAADPKAPRVPIIAHPDVRRMLLEMKSRVEGMRALLYFTGMCVDKADTLSDPEQIARWSALRGMLMPLCRIYTADAGFDVCRTAVQVHGRYGYFKGSLVEQFLRDVKVQSIWELTTGMHSLIFVAQIMPQNQGRDFGILLETINQTIADYQTIGAIADLTNAVRKAVDLLEATAQFMNQCAQSGNMLVPIANAVAFMHLMGAVASGWLLYWQAGLAVGRLESLCRQHHVDPSSGDERDQFVAVNSEAAFYDGKVHSARYFFNHVLPAAEAIAQAIKNEALSIMAIRDEGF